MTRPPFVPASVIPPVTSSSGTDSQTGGAKVATSSPAPAMPPEFAADKQPADPIQTQLAQAKIAYQSAISNAKQSLVRTIDASLNAATDAGDLNAVQALQEVKVNASKDGTVPDDVKDPAIRAAKTSYSQNIVNAKTTLAAAYQSRYSRLYAGAKN